MDDPKAFMMENYKEKNELLKEWDRQIAEGTAGGDAWMAQFTHLQSNRMECVLYQAGHLALMILTAVVFDRLRALLQTGFALFCLVAGCHTVGWALNSTSMESVPFETGIKSIALSLEKRRCKDVKSA